LAWPHTHSPQYLVDLDIRTFLDSPPSTRGGRSSIDQALISRQAATIIVQAKIATPCWPTEAMRLLDLRHSLAIWLLSRKAATVDKLKDMMRSEAGAFPSLDQFYSLINDLSSLAEYPLPPYQPGGTWLSPSASGHTWTVHRANLSDLLFVLYDKRRITLNNVRPSRPIVPTAPAEDAGHADETTAPEPEATDKNHLSSRSFIVVDDLTVLPLDADQTYDMQNDAMREIAKDVLLHVSARAWSHRSENWLQQVLTRFRLATRQSLSADTRLHDAIEAAVAHAAFGEPWRCDLQVVPYIAWLRDLKTIKFDSLTIASIANYAVDCPVMAVNLSPKPKLITTAVSCADAPFIEQLQRFAERFCTSVDFNPPTTPPVGVKGQIDWCIMVLEQLHSLP
jgi:hypothetical protein